MMNKAKSKKLTLGMPPFDVPKVTKMLVWRGDDLAALSSIPLNSVFFTMGSSIKDVRKFLSVFNPPPSPLLDFVPPSRLVCIPVFESLKERSRECEGSCSCEELSGVVSQ